MAEWSSEEEKMSSMDQSTARQKEASPKTQVSEPGHRQSSGHGQEKKAQNHRQVSPPAQKEVEEAHTPEWTPKTRRPTAKPRLAKSLAGNWSDGPTPYTDSQVAKALKGPVAANTQPQGSWKAKGTDADRNHHRLTRKQAEPQANRLMREKHQRDRPHHKPLQTMVKKQDARPKEAGTRAKSQK